MQQFPKNDQNHKHHIRLQAELVKLLANIYDGTDHHRIKEVNGFMQWDTAHEHRKELVPVAKNRDQINHQQECHPRDIRLEAVAHHDQEEQQTQ